MILYDILTVRASKAHKRIPCLMPCDSKLQPDKCILTPSDGSSDGMNTVEFSDIRYSLTLRISQYSLFCTNIKVKLPVCRYPSRRMYANFSTSSRGAYVA